MSRRSKDHANTLNNTTQAISDTLRIPLAARAFGDSLFPEIAVHDTSARTALEQIGEDGDRWLKDRHSVYGTLIRTGIYRDRALRYLEQYPDGHVVNLGCGLSNYFQWLDNGRCTMTTADLPNVIAQRQQVLGPPSQRQQVRELDLCQPGWWDRLGLPIKNSGAPVFLICEGVLMYLSPASVNAILAEFGECAPAGSTLIFDCMCWLAMGRAKRHRSIKHTQAEIGWGPRRLTDLAYPSARLSKPSVHQVMEGYGLPFSIIGPVFRWLLKIPFYAVYELKTA